MIPNKTAHQTEMDTPIIDNHNNIIVTESVKAESDNSLFQSDTKNKINFRLTQVINDRDSLKIKMRYAESTIRELHAQNRELHCLLRCAQDTVRSSDLGKPTQIHPRDLDLSHTPTWIGGTWLSVAKTMPLLAESEAAWQTGKSQQALALLTSILHEEGLKPSHRVTAGLLYSAILRSNGDLEGALHCAEENLNIAQETEQIPLAGKAQFHRGLCCLYLDRYVDARWCFVLASHTEGHAELIQEYLIMTQRKIGELAVGDPRGRHSL